MACLIFVLIGLYKQLSMKAALWRAGFSFTRRRRSPLALPRSSHTDVLFPAVTASAGSWAHTDTDPPGEGLPGPRVGDGEHGSLCLASAGPCRGCRDAGSWLCTPSCSQRHWGSHLHPPAHPGPCAAAAASQVPYGTGNPLPHRLWETTLTQINNAINCEVMKELNTLHFESTKHQNPQIN